MFACCALSGGGHALHDGCGLHGRHALPLLLLLLLQLRPLLAALVLLPLLSLAAAVAVGLHPHALPAGRATQAAMSELAGQLAHACEPLPRQPPLQPPHLGCATAARPQWAGEPEL